MCKNSSRGVWWRVQASRVADAALIPTPQIVSRVQPANIFRLLLVIGFFPFLFSVCRSFQTIARSITSNAKRTPKPTPAARVELAPTGPTRLNPPTSVILSPSHPMRVGINRSGRMTPARRTLRNASLVAQCFPVSPQSKPEILYGQRRSEKQFTWPTRRSAIPDSPASRTQTLFPGASLKVICPVWVLGFVLADFSRTMARNFLNSKILQRR